MKKTFLYIAIAALSLLSTTANAANSNGQTGFQPADTVQNDSTRLAPDFTLNDLQGKPLSLSSLRGKYVILDFWGTWCPWCIKGIPKMKEYYNKYKGKFEILSIDCHDTEEKWKEGVKKYALPWLNVYNTQSSGVLNAYGIEGFPTKIVINPEGKIIKTVLGEDPSFYEFLDEIF